MKCNITFSSFADDDKHDLLIYSKDLFALYEVIFHLGKDYVLTNVFITDDSKKESK